MPDDGMPADPFKGEADWDVLAAGCAGLFGALVAHGMPEQHSLELAARYLHFMLGVVFASAQQQAQEPGDSA